MNVLILEDEPLIALATQMLVEDEGYGVVGPFATVGGALGAVTSAAAIDCALLDCFLGSEASWPVADALIARSVPFAFTSGNSASSMEPRFAKIPIFIKPVSEPQLQAFLRKTAAER